MLMVRKFCEEGQDQLHIYSFSEFITTEDDLFHA